MRLSFGYRYLFHCRELNMEPATDDCASSMCSLRCVGESQEKGRVVQAVVELKKE